MSQSTIAVIIIFVFAFIPLILAEVARKNSVATIEDFFIYSRKMPLLYAFCTIFATWRRAGFRRFLLPKRPNLYNLFFLKCALCCWDISCRQEDLVLWQQRRISYAVGFLSGYLRFPPCHDPGHNHRSCFHSYSDRKSVV